MEIFELPLDVVHLQRYVRYISILKGVPYRQYKHEVNQLLSGDMGKVWRRRRIIHRLLQKYGVNDQRSAQWHSKRSEMITASEVTKAFSDATPSARRELILKKVEGAKESDGSGMNTACAWGTQFEPVAKYLYCKLNGGGEVVDTSCVVHPVYSFLGASPDGIYFTPSRSDPRWGKLIEFKCPISRKFDETTPIPDAYYHQMQMQMECTDIDECDYVEMRFATLTQTDWLSHPAQYKGKFALFDSGKINYDYENDPDWRRRMRDIEDDECRIIYWVLANWRVANVKRDYTWLSTHIEDLKSTWNEVLEHRKNGTVPEKIEKVSEVVSESGVEVINGAVTSEPHKVQPEVQSIPLVVPSVDQEPSCCSSSVHKKNAKTLQFDLG